MIKKIFKTILVLSLCLGITLPTNAAVSVSDGSAFVTKAEFAADLNNLSNRMAQLENSLDAKIDSLVSSYLTRNGIWNGAKQNFLVGTAQADGSVRLQGFNTSGVGMTTGESDELSFPKWYKSRVYLSSTPNRISQTSGDYMPYEKYFTSSKSGLCNLKIYFRSSDQYNRLGTLVAFKDLHNSDTSTGYGQIQPNFGTDGVFYAGNDTNKIEVGRIRLSSADAVGSISFFGTYNANTYLNGYNVFMLNYIVGQQQLYFFINKDESLYARIEFFWQCSSTIQAEVYTTADYKFYSGSSVAHYIYNLSANIY